MIFVNPEVGDRARLTGQAATMFKRISVAGYQKKLYKDNVIVAK